MKFFFLGAYIPLLSHGDKISPDQPFSWEGLPVKLLEKKTNAMRGFQGVPGAPVPERGTHLYKVNVRASVQTKCPSHANSASGKNLVIGICM